MKFCNGATMDRCIALWHRVGMRPFRVDDVNDLLLSSSQLRAMANRGMVECIGHEEKRYGKYQTKSVHIWQMTENARVLAECHPHGERDYIPEAS